MAKASSAVKTRTAVARLGPWFHNLHLPGGIETAPDHPLGDFPAWKWHEIADCLPRDLSGWRALDIGCNAGFHSFELARRGAVVTAIDADARYLRQARWAARQYDLASGITFKRSQVHSLAGAREGYDLVLFMGVFYHLRYPLLALDTVYRLQPRLMLFQTLTTDEEAVSPHAEQDIEFATRQRLREPGWPSMAFIEQTFCKDPTNWWVPNHAGVMALLRSAGFQVLEQPGHEVYLCRCEAGREPDAEPEWRAAVRAGRANARH